MRLLHFTQKALRLGQIRETSMTEEVALVKYLTKYVTRPFRSAKRPVCLRAVTCADDARSSGTT